MVRKEEQRGFNYQRRSTDAYKERANMRGGNFDTLFKPKFKQWKPKEGKNRIRILPPTWKGAKHCGFDIFVNYGIGPDNQSYLSLSKHGQGDDPLAEARRDALNEGDKEYAKKLQTSQRILYWIIDRMDEEEGPLLWAAPFTFDKALMNLCIDEDTKAVIELDHPVEGRDIRFYREGSQLNTKYDPSRMKLMDPSSIHEDEGIEEEWLDFIKENPLPDVLNFYSYDHIKAQFAGQSAKDDGENEEKPQRTRKHSKPIDGGDDPDEDEKPSRSKASRRQVDDDDPDDAEKAEKPSRRRAVSRRDVEDDDDSGDGDADGDNDNRRRGAKDDDDDPPARSRRGDSTKSRNDEDDEPAPRRTRAQVNEDPEEEAEEDERPTRSRRGKSDDDGGDDDEKPKSLREKLAARRRSQSSDDD
jgi:hypothetical protein